jgi:hypothetical protein
MRHDEQLALLRRLRWRPGWHLWGAWFPWRWACRAVRPEVPCLLSVSPRPPLLGPKGGVVTHSVVLAGGLVYDPHRDGPCGVARYGRLGQWVREVLEQEGAG